MADDRILDAARADTRGNVYGSLILAILCAGVLALNWKYVYNFAAGPFPFDPNEAQFPASITREFVRAEGPLLRTGWAQQTTIGLLRGLVQTTSESAEYLAMKTGGRLLIVKVPVDYPGQVVEGRLVPLPEAIRTSLGESATYQWMLDAKTPYRWDFNLFVMIAAPLFLLSLLMMAIFGWQSGSVLRHAAIANLKSFGAPLDVVAAIEKDIRAAGAAARIGHFVVTPAWFVAMKPSLKIVSARNLVGAAAIAPGPKGSSRWTIALWIRGQRVEEKLSAQEGDARAVLARIKSTMPWAVVSDPAAFAKRWTDDRGSCEREAHPVAGG